MKTIIEMAKRAGYSTELGDQFINFDMNHFTTLVKAARDAELLMGVEMPPMPRAFLCTKCGSREFQGNINEPHPPCAKCNYLGFASDTGYTADQMRETVAAAVAKKEAELDALHKKATDAIAAKWKAEVENERLQAQTNERGALAIQNGIRMQRAEAENERKDTEIAELKTEIDRLDTLAITWKVMYERVSEACQDLDEERKTLKAENENLRAESKPNCRECTKWVKEQADNKEWIEGVQRGREICEQLAAAAMKGKL